MPKDSTEIATRSLVPNNIQEILEVFPLATLIPEVYQQLPREEGQWFWMRDQMSKLKLAYQAIYDMAGNTGFLMPMIFRRPENTPNLEVIWLGEHDPFGLGDITPFHASSIWQESDGTLKLEIVIHSWLEYSGLVNDQARKIVKLVNPQLFNAAFRAFESALGIFIPCPHRVEDDISDHHPNPCEVCHGQEYIRLGTSLSDRYNPAAVFGLITNTNYGEEEPK